MREIHPQILSKDGKPQFAVLPYDEYLQLRHAAARLAEQQFTDPRYGGVFDNLSAEELARRQGVKPIENTDQLYGAGDPADWEGFDEWLEESRRNSPLT